MSGAPLELPARPSPEHLRKQAKRIAKERSIALGSAQRLLAARYGSPNWADLMRRVGSLHGHAAAPLADPLAIAARAGDLAAIRRLLAEGHPADGAPNAGGTPLWHACASDIAAPDRLDIVEALLAAGAGTRRDDAGETALHAAAARGPLRLVERLIRAGAIEWQRDRKGRTPLQAARQGRGADAVAIAELLDRPVIRDPSFRAAVAAIHRGDPEDLGRILDAEPRLLRDRIAEPDCYRDAGRHQYFRDPKLFWFIANNPRLTARMPANIADLARTMVARGVGQSDLDYALELVMTGSAPRERRLQAQLIGLLLKAGAVPTPQAVEMTLGHRELAAVKALLAAGHPMTLPIAAAMGLGARVGTMLRTASPEEAQAALGMAVINRRHDAARLALDAGADPNLPLPVHSHSLPLHQAALDENLELIDLLLARGARLDIPDTLWGSTPLGWAIHQGKPGARAALERWAAKLAAGPR